MRGKSAGYFLPFTFFALLLQRYAETRTACCVFACEKTGKPMKSHLLKHSLLLFLLLCSLTAAAANRNFTLVIDAGHGGHDAGAVGSFSKEKDINLRVALAFGKLVEQNCDDVRVVYTRKTDVFIPLQRRADIANNQKADLFVSIHTNALPEGRIAYGSETYTLGMARANANLAVAKRENSVITLETDYKTTYQGFDPSKAESYVIFEFMQDKHMKQSVDLADCIQRQYKQAGRPNKGVHQAGFLVLRNTSMPSVLTELGFITTPAEETYLNSAEGTEALSRSIYNGFLAYRRLHEKGARNIPENLPLLASNQSQAAPAAEKEVAVVPVATVPTSKLTAQNTPQPAEAPKAANKTTTAAAKVEKKPETKTKSAAAPVQEKTAKKPEAKENTQKTSAKDTKSTTKDTKTSSSTTKEKKQEATTAKKATSKVSYRIQVGAGKTEIAVTDAQFKGVKVTRTKEGSLYKYYAGTYSTYAEAQKQLSTVKAKLPNAYIVATVDGKSVSVAEARAKEKEKK